MARSGASIHWSTTWPCSSRWTETNGKGTSTLTAGGFPTHAAVDPRQAQHTPGWIAGPNGRAFFAPHAGGSVARSARCRVCGTRAAPCTTACRWRCTAWRQGCVCAHRCAAWMHAGTGLPRRIAKTRERTYAWTQATHPSNGWIWGVRRNGRQST